MAVDANAASQVCRQLQGQLASAWSGGGSPRVERAIARQRGELAKANRQLRSAQCGFLARGGVCGSIRGTISRMESNLAGLERQRSGGGGRSRARILAALDANGCNNRSPQRDMVARSDGNGGNLLSAFFGTQQRQSAVERSPRRMDDADRKPGWVRRLEEERKSEFRNRSAEERRRDAATARQGVIDTYGSGGYQTVCVRVSDGYYFPISPASSRSNFARDTNNCQAMCPSDEVQLFYKALDSDDTDAMISTSSGRPYAMLATAYKYRDQPTPGCSGDRNAAEAAAEKERMKETAASFEFPIPPPKPDTENTIPAWIGAEKVETAPPGERQVRVVGPAFLPDRSTEEDQPAQVPILAQ